MSAPPVPGLPCDAEGPVFGAPWQAQAFAMTLALYERSLRAVARVLRPGGVVYLEAARAWSDEELAPFVLSVYRHLKAGVVHAHLLRAAGSA